MPSCRCSPCLPSIILRYNCPERGPADWIVKPAGPVSKKSPSKRCILITGLIYSSRRVRFSEHHKYWERLHGSLYRIEVIQKETSWSTKSKTLRPTLWYNASDWHLTKVLVISAHAHAVTQRVDADASFVFIRRLSIESHEASRCRRGDTTTDASMTQFITQWTWLYSLSSWFTTLLSIVNLSARECNGVSRVILYFTWFICTDWNNGKTKTITKHFSF